MSHPLVFRKKKMNSAEFSDQFRLAIIDFIQDRFLTDRAYDMSLDKSFEVAQSASIWKDSFLAYQSSLLFDQSASNENRHIKMKPIIDKLQDKYDKNIFITPGSIFGSNGDGYVRISLCCDEKKLKEALKRL